MREIKNRWDEALSNLDAKLRTTERTELQELHRKLDIKTTYVDHNQEVAMTMADRFAIFDPGELHHIGEPIECYHKLANTFVGGFIGSPKPNLFKGEYFESEFFSDTTECEVPADI